MSDIVLVGGVEKMTDVNGGEATFALGTAADQEYEGFHGLTFPGLYAMMAVAHMHKYGTTREQLAMVAVKNHDNGSKNPLAQYPVQGYRGAVLNSVLVADPLRILDCSPITDGAAGVDPLPARIRPRTLKKPLVQNHRQRAGHGHDRPQLAEGYHLDRIDALRGQKALAMAGKKIEDIHLFEVHDCFTIAEIWSRRPSGSSRGARAARRSRTALTSLTGKYPVNPSGGLKAKGHPGRRDGRGPGRGSRQAASRRGGRAAGQGRPSAD